MDGYPQRDTIFEFIYFISSVRSVGWFLFSLLFMRIFLDSAASWFGRIVFFYVSADFFFNHLVFLGLCVYPRFWHTMNRWLLISVSSIIAILVYLCDSLLLPPIVVFRTSKLILLLFCKFVFIYHAKFRVSTS